MSIEQSDLAKLYPLETLRPDTLAQLAAEAVLVEYAKEEVLFREGEADDQTYYLLEGEVSGIYTDGRVKNVNAQSLQGRYALGDSQPRRFTASVVSSAGAKVVRFERRFLEKVITWDQLTRSENFNHFDPSPEGNRWVFRLLQSRAFHKLPTGNIERMFRRFEEVHVKAGDTIVREGQEADYFYVIKEGAAQVSKYLDGVEATVAYLRQGDCFGEDALLANTTRNATVKMMQDGHLMRLGRKSFEEVLKPPVVDWLTPGQASIMSRQGAKVIDVRLPAEFEQRAIKDAENVPLYRLREIFNERYDRAGRYIVYDNTGERSAAAAFILTRLGFTVFALQGGITGMLRQIDRKP